jgi:hypothetical protein
MKKHYIAIHQIISLSGDPIWSLFVGTYTIEVYF